MGAAPPTPPPRIRRSLGSEAAGLSIGAALAGLAAARRGKAFHPNGAVYEAHLTVSGAPGAPEGAELLAGKAEHDAVVRFSRAIGLPRPLPDLLGLSLRVINAYGMGRDQDFLLVTSADYPLLHHIFLPAADVQQRPYTSSLPYRANDELFLVGVVPRRDSPRPAGANEFDRLRAAAATGRLTFDLAIAPLAGRFRAVGRLQVGDPLGQELDALRFNPWNTGGGLEPAGWLNRARNRAYKLSQSAWRRARRDGAQVQDTADRVLALLKRNVDASQ